VVNKEELGLIRVSKPSKPAIFLRDIAKITLNPSPENNQKFKTSGVESLILFADPREGGNIKNMADQTMAELKKIESQWPQDIQYKVLVNPSEFINNSIEGVVREVFLAALLAVVVLFVLLEVLRML